MTLKRVDDGLGFIFNDELQKRLYLKEGDDVEIEVTECGLVLRPVDGSKEIELFLRKTDY